MVGICEEILNVTGMVVLTSNFNNNKDLELIASLIDLCEEVKKKIKRRRRKEWVQPWRYRRLERGSFSSLSKELSIDKTSFFEYIGINEAAFNYILSGIESKIRKQDTVMRQSVPPADRLAATLRFLATGDSFKSTNYQTRLSDSFLIKAIPEVCRAIWNTFKDEYLKFPTTITEWKAIADNFAIKWQFPHCLGALDTKRITFKASRKVSILKNRYKGKNCIVLLALADADCRFIYIDVRYNAHDADILELSGLGDIINNADEHFPPDEVIGNGRKLPYVIIGDYAFPLGKHIMKPYSRNINGNEKIKYNIRISRARQAVDHAFGVLSTRFKILQRSVITSVENVELFTKTCCLLHNILSSKCDNYLHYSSSAVETASDSSSALPQKAKDPAEPFRQMFVEYFKQEGKFDLEDANL